MQLKEENRIKKNNSLQTIMALAIETAKTGAEKGEVPIGAVLVCDGEILARAHNQKESLADPTAHAEMLAIRRAAEAIGSERLDQCDLWVTLEPCAMCAGAILSSRIATLVYGAWDDKAGAVGSRYDLVRDRRLPERAVVIAGVREAECAALVRGFFRD